MEHGTEGLVCLGQPPSGANLGPSVSIRVHPWLNFGVRVQHRDAARRDRHQRTDWDIRNSELLPVPDFMISKLFPRRRGEDRARRLLGTSRHCRLAPRPRTVIVRASIAVSMQYLLEHFGVAVAAITGVLAARGKRLDLFGVMVLAVVTAFGGGTVRDLCLAKGPVFWMNDPYYLLNATGVAVFTFFVARVWEFPETVLLVADAFALAFFTMVGVQKSLTLGTAPTIAVAMGVITGVVGGMLRDVLSGEIPLVFRQKIYLYATAALVGAVVFVLLRRWFPHERIVMMIATTTTLGLRLAAIRWKVSLPEFEPKPPGADETAPKP